MLTSAKKGTRVLLANDMKATVVSVNTGWGRDTTYSIKADGGKHKTRTYNEAGKALEGPASMNVKSLITAGYKGTVEKLATSLDAFRASMETAFDSLEAELAAMQEQAAQPPADTLTAYDFQDGKGSVPAKRHINPEGDEGGIVAATAYVDSTSRIGRGSVVFGTARVTNRSKVINNSRIGGDARVDNKEVDGAEIIGTKLRSIAA